MRFGIFLFVAFVLLAGLWSLLRPLPQATPAAPAVSAAAPAEGASTLRRLHIDVPSAAAAIAILQARAGDQIELSVRSDQDDELHLHGYDLSLALRAGEPGTLRFTAAHAGRFEIELHDAHSQIGVLEVAPR